MRSAMVSSSLVEYVRLDKGLMTMMMKKQIASYSFGAISSCPCVKTY